MHDFTLRPTPGPTPPLLATSERHATCPPRGPTDRYSPTRAEVSGWQPEARAPGPPGPEEEKARREQLQEADRQKAEEIRRRMEADRILWEAKMLALLADLQTDLFKIWQEVMLNRRKVHDQIMKAWHAVITG